MIDQHHQTPGIGIPLLEVDEICNDYDGSPLLREVSFTLARKDILCLLGPSGSGKTTLLRIIAGLERQSSGAILVNGHNIGPVPPHKRKIGMMFQEYALFPHKTVWSNVAFGLEMQGCPGKLLEQKVSAMLELVGLASFGKRRVDELSGGEKQRVALARSLVAEPELLLLDEPLGSLDRVLRERLMGEIRSILKILGVSAIFVTHDQEEAFTVADRIGVLQDGILQQLAPPEKLYRTPATARVAHFLGFTNFVKVRRENSGVFRSMIDSLGEIPQAVSDGEDNALLLIRPDGASCLAGEVRTTSPTLTGKVVSRIFHGSSYRLTIKSTTYTLSFDLPIDPAPPGPGETISLRINPAALVLLSDDRAGEALSG